MKRKKRSYRKSGIDATKFVLTWQASRDLTEFCKKTGLEQRKASSRAVFYRLKGIPLKRFPRGGGGFERKELDVSALKKLAKSSAP